MNLQAEILYLSAAYVVLGALLLLAMTRARLPWPVKAGAIAITSAFYVVFFVKAQGLLGWSAHEALPARFQLLWARTVEPDLAADLPGTIHLWIEELDDANLPSGVPRAYALPYSAVLAEKVDAARREIMDGHPQGGRAADFGAGGGELPPGAPPAPLAPAAQPGGDPSGGGLLDPTFLGGDSKHVEFAPLPAPILPPKDAP